MKKYKAREGSYHQYALIGAWMLLGIILLTIIGGVPKVLGQEGVTVMSASTYKSIFYSGEPVLISLSLTNNRQEPVQFSALSLESQTIRFSIRSGNGSFKEFGLSYVREPTVMPVELAGGETYRHEDLIHYNYDLNMPAFPAPGRYTVRVDYVGYFSKSPTPAPAEITFTVIANPEEEKQGAALFSRVETANFMNGIDREAGVAVQIKEYIAANPDSLFSLYGKYALALSVAEDFSGAVPDIQEAVNLMQGVDKAGFQLQPLALVHLAQWSWELGNAAGAMDYLNRAIGDFPDTHTAHLAGQIKNNIQGRTPPVPILPTAKGEPVIGALLNEITAVINSFFDLYQLKDRTGVLDMLDEAFIYNEFLDKNSYAAELDEDFVKLQTLPGEFMIDRKAGNVEKLDGKLFAELELTYRVDDQVLSALKKVKIELIQVEGRWILKSWRDM